MALEGLHVRVLGALQVDGVPAADLGSRKARTLLCALAVARGRPVPAAVLVEVVWGDDPPSDPSGQLSVLASRLRRALGRDRVVRGDAGYFLVADWIDVDELQGRTDEAVARLAAGNPVAARLAAAAAVALVRGRLAAEEDAVWFDETRVIVDREVRRVRSVLAEAALLGGDAGTAAVVSETLLDDDPYDESALRTLMRAHVALGRPATALDVYARLRARLAEDLGVSPSSETEELHTAILLADSTTSTVDAGPTLVGRRAELDALDLALDRAGAGAAVGVVVVGEPGIGKSALVHAFTHRARAGGAVVLAGRCDALGRDLPLQPVLEALDDHLAMLGDDGDALLGADAAVIGPLLRSPNPAAPAVTTVRDRDVEQVTLFRSLLAVLERLAGVRPVVVVVEDVHIAEASTQEWLRFAVRRGKRMLIVTTRRPDGSGSSTGSEHVELGPLDLVAAETLIGSDRAAALLERSGGNPLFMLELAAAAPGDELPRTITESVEGRLAALGEGAAVVRAAAVLGPSIDLDLLASVLDMAVVDLLDGLELAERARVLVADGHGLRFAHELVRLAIEQATSVARQSVLHRHAANVLVERGRADASVVAWHARLGGDVQLAADALIAAADQALVRHDVERAIELLTESLDLVDQPSARLARARAGMAIWELDGAADDARRAMASGGGAEALETAGWVAYYRRDYDEARRFADEGVARSAEPALRASCLALAGRCRHTSGDLAGAEERLTAAVHEAPAPTRGVAQIWLASLRGHTGHPLDAVELAGAGVLDPSAVTHPFGIGHGYFARACSLGMLGRPVDALAELDRLDAAVNGTAQARRFQPVSANVRGWISRWLGDVDGADEQNMKSAELADEVAVAEPRYVGHLDLAVGRLLVGDLDGARSRLDGIAGIETWVGSMSWRQRHRYRLYRAWLAFGEGELESAASMAHSVAVDAAGRGSRRYELFGRLLAARASAAAGQAVDLSSVRADLAALDEVAGLEAWWFTADMGETLAVDEWRAMARDRVEGLASRSGPHAEGLLRWANDRLGSVL